MCIHFYKNIYCIFTNFHVDKKYQIRKGFLKFSHLNKMHCYIQCIEYSIYIILDTYLIFGAIRPCIMSKVLLSGCTLLVVPSLVRTIKKPYSSIPTMATSFITFSAVCTLTIESLQNQKY